MAVSCGPYMGDAGRTQRGGGALPIRFEGVSYAAGATAILDGVDLELDADGPTVLLGPNGCGKTTLIKLAMGLVRPTAGRVTFDGADAPPRGSRAIVFQKPVMMRRSVVENLVFALSAAGRSASRAELGRLLDLAGIAPLVHRPARRLSGGEQQRLALARALAREPEVLFLDEPTASLDPAASKLVEDIIVRVAGAGVKIVMATHDLGQARRLAHEVVFLAKGQLLERAAAQDFFAAPASEAARRFLAGDLLI